MIISVGGGLREARRLLCVMCDARDTYVRQLRLTEMPPTSTEHHFQWVTGPTSGVPLLTTEQPS